jgi:hypothetical protein
MFHGCSFFYIIAAIYEDNKSGVYLAFVLIKHQTRLTAKASFAAHLLTPRFLEKLPGIKKNATFVAHYFKPKNQKQ